MTWALVTGGNERFSDLLEITAPRALDAAEAWDMDFVQEPISCSWDKVPLLRDLLKKYEGVMWVDADAVILRTDRDPRLDLGGFCWGWVVHHLPQESVPNCGVLLIRRSYQRVLDQVAKWRPNFKEHPWWEQAAAMRVFGWEPTLGEAEFVGGSTLQAAELPLEWNVLPDRLPHPCPRILHASGMPLEDRLTILKQWT